MATNVYLASKPRYEILDGLRGVAAVLVVLFHLLETYPLMYMQMNWAWSHPDAPAYAHVMVCVACFLLSIGIAYACLKLYDIPVRKWLTEKWLKR